MARVTAYLCPGSLDGPSSSCRCEGWFETVGPQHGTYLLVAWLACGIVLCVWWVSEVSGSHVTGYCTCLAVVFGVQPAVVIRTLRSTWDPGL